MPLAAPANAMASYIALYCCWLNPLYSVVLTCSMALLETPRAEQYRESRDFCIFTSTAHRIGISRGLFRVCQIRSGLSMSTIKFRNDNARCGAQTISTRQSWRWMPRRTDPPCSFTLRVHHNRSSLRFLVRCSLQLSGNSIVTPQPQCSPSNLKQRW